MARRPAEPVAPKGYPDARRREPLWDRVDANRLRLAGYVALFVVSAVVVFDAMFILLGGVFVLLIGGTAEGVLGNSSAS